jgi:hydrogenase nickel incorporation protein HypA/HybF
MHELALARDLVDQVLQVVERERFERVSRVVLELGTAAGVDADALSLGFEIAARGSPLEGARLEIDPLQDGQALRVKLIETWP